MGLTPFEWFQVAASVGAFLGAVGVFLWGRGRSEARQEARVKSLEMTIERAGARMSKLASFIQGLPTKTDLATLWHAIDELREHNATMREHLATLKEAMRLYAENSEK